MNERCKFLLYSFIVYVVLAAVGFLIVFPDYLQAQNATLTEQNASVASLTQDAASTQNAAWKAVERIDNKIANAIVLLTVFAALLPIVAALYGQSKLHELERIKEGQKENIQKEVGENIQRIKEEQKKVIENEVREKLKYLYEKSEENYSQQVNKMIHNSVSNASDRLYNFLDEYDSRSSRIIVAYLNNDIGGDDGAISSSELASVFHLQRDLRNLAGADQDNIYASLVYLEEILPRLALITAVEVYEYLLMIERQGKIITLNNREIWAELLNSIQEKHQIPASFKLE